MIAINLIPHQRRRVWALRSRAVWWCAGVAAYSAAFVALCLVLRPDGSELARVQSDLDDARVRHAALTKELGTERARIDQMSRRLQTARAVGEHPDWSVLLGLLAQLRGEMVVLESIRIEPLTADASTQRAAAPSPAGGRPTADRRQTSGAVGEAYRLTIAGVAPTPSAVSALALSMEATGLFEAVNQGAVQSRSVRGQSVRTFTIAATLTSGAVGERTDVTSGGGR